MLRLYDYWESGNAYKVRLALTQLGVEFERVPVDILAGATHTEEFRRLNPVEKVPVLQLADGRCLSESNAILFFLASQYGLHRSLLQRTTWEQAEALQWMFFEQYSHEPYIAVVRFWHFTGTVDEHRGELQVKMERGYHALGVMDEHLKQNPFFAGNSYSIADIALYAYTHVAAEGQFDLEPYGAVREWLARVAEQPGHVTIHDETGTLVTT